MSLWRSWRVYYSDIDFLLRAWPLARTAGEAGLERLVWTRGYPGGTHLQICACGNASALDLFEGSLLSRVLGFMQSNPSKPDEGYSVSRVRESLRRESSDASEYDLSYRVDKIEAVPYNRSPRNMVSAAAFNLLEEFLEETGPLALTIVATEEPPFQHALRMYFLLALQMSGSLKRGAVSAKSHWSGFCGFNAVPSVTEAIVSQYQRQRPAINGLMKRVLAYHSDRTLRSDPILDEWLRLLTKYRRSAQELLAKGIEVCPYLTEDEIASVARAVSPAQFESSRFLRLLWKDPRFLSSLRFSPSLKVPRVLTNLFYAFIASLLGFRPIDKMTLCYFISKAVEDEYRCDLTDIFAETISAVIGSVNQREAV